MSARWALVSVLAAAILTGAAAPAAGQTAADAEAGIRAYNDRGNAREAIRRIGDALDAGAVPPGSRLRAHVYMASAFLALGDTASAVPHVQWAISIHPCATPAGEITPPEWMALYERYRPADASCSAWKTVTAPLRSMIVPGWGQRSLGRGGASLAFFGASAASAGLSALLATHADGRYEAYRASTTYPELLDLYDQAEGSRRAAIVFGGMAAGFYAWNVIDALIGGIAHDREVRPGRGIAAAPLVVPGAGGGTGLAFRVPLR